MKKAYLLLSLSALAFLFLSCRPAVFEEETVPHGYSTVTITVGDTGSMRSNTEPGLPELKKAKMKIEVTPRTGNVITNNFDTDDEKKLSVTLPVGEEITVEVTVTTKSAEWMGEARHRVDADPNKNKVTIKIDKKAAVLHNLYFTVLQENNEYTVKLKVGDKKIEKKDLIYSPVFCRDNKGRIYLAYNTGNEWKIERYTSEGEDDKTFSLPEEHLHHLILASDHATGAVYLVGEINGQMKLYRINEDGIHTELTGAAIGYPTGYAVYKNILISTHSQTIKMYRITGDTFSEIRLSPSPSLSADTKIMLGSSPAHHVDITDLYMTEKNLYVLFAGYSTSREYYSLGGIVKYSYTAQDTSGTISTPQRIGINAGHTADAHGIYPTDESTSFYGPVKVVGFDKEKLYIADDGVSFEAVTSGATVKANHDRIAELELNGENPKLSFSDAPSDVKWNRDETIKGTAEVIIEIGDDGWSD